MQEKEVDCLEKDLDIKDLKEQVVSLSGLLAQLKIQKAELNHRDKLQVSAFGCGVIFFLHPRIENILTEPE